MARWRRMSKPRRHGADCRLAWERGLHSPGARRRLSEWAEEAVCLLRRAYGSEAPVSGADGERVEEALALLMERAREMAGLQGSPRLDPEAFGADALAILVEFLDGAMSPRRID